MKILNGKYPKEYEVDCTFTIRELDAIYNAIDYNCLSRQIVILEDHHLYDFMKKYREFTKSPASQDKE